MVVDINRKPLFAKFHSKPRIAVGILSHAVGDLHDAADGAEIGGCGTLGENITKPGSGLKGKFVGQKLHKLIP